MNESDKRNKAQEEQEKAIEKIKTRDCERFNLVSTLLENESDLLSSCNLGYITKPKFHLRCPFCFVKLHKYENTTPTTAFSDRIVTHYYCDCGYHYVKD